MMQFPKDFFWGAATSAYQVEGNNQYCDWWEWEKKAGKEPSGDACKHYEFFRQDFDLAKQLNHNAHRLSIEWSRIEPEEGKFSSKELGHYLDVINALKERGLEPVVTLHHFTNPLWFANSGGWENKKASVYFLRYTEKIIEAFCNGVKYWVTINEPLVYVHHSYIIGAWPPQARSILRAKKVKDNLAAAHIQAYRLIHGIYKRKSEGPPLVSIAQNMQAFLACNLSLKNRMAVYLRDKLFNRDFLEVLRREKALDYIGLNYYSRSLVEVERWGLRGLLMDVCEKNHHPAKKNSLGWDIYPQGLYLLLSKLKRYNLPVFILENGICTDDDGLRWNFIYEHLKNVYSAIASGVKVLGYLYWSLIDNFEWAEGFRARFGLVDIDYHSYRRTIRESARKFAEVCKTGKLV